MKIKRSISVIVLVLLFTLVTQTSSVFSQEIELTPKYFTIKDFSFKSGEVIPELKVEYATFGTMEKDSAGNIINGIVWCHGWSGNYAQVKLSKDIVGPNKAIDSNQFFIICPTATGSIGSSSPSTSRLGPKFPKYTAEDMIKAQYILVTEHLKINHLKGVVGPSMGGFQALEWAVSYPDFMDFIIPMATSYEFKGRIVGIYTLMSNSIKRDPSYQDGNHKDQPKVGMENAFMGTYLWYFGPTYYKIKFPTNEILLKALKDVGLGSAKMDANDVIWRNEAMMSYNTKNRISNVKAKALVIGVNQDELFPSDTDTIPLAKALKGAQLFTYDSIAGHLGCVVHIKKAESVIRDFLRE